MHELRATERAELDRRLQDWTTDQLRDAAKVLALMDDEDDV